MIKIESTGLTALAVTEVSVLFDPSVGVPLPASANTGLATAESSRVERAIFLSFKV
ncbi:hypothetical protein D3C75_1129470 [compost metagenome]